MAGTVVNQSTLEGYFDPGDEPTSTQFKNLIESVALLHSGTTNTFSGSMQISGSLTMGQPATTSTVSVNGTIAGNRKITAVTEALDLSSVATAMPYSGGIFTIDADGASYALTLPTATSAAEATQVLGWYANAVLIDVHATNDVTIVRGDTTNDTITSHGIVGIAASGASGALTITSDVITFDASDDAAVGDNVDIYCYASSATVTAYGAKAICAS